MSLALILRTVTSIFWLRASTQLKYFLNNCFVNFPLIFFVLSFCFKWDFEEFQCKCTHVLLHSSIHSNPWPWHKQIDVKFQREVYKVRTYIQQEEYKVQTCIQQEEYKVRTYIQQEEYKVRTYIQQEEYKKETCKNLTRSILHWVEEEG